LYFTKIISKMFQIQISRQLERLLLFQLSLTLEKELNLSEL